MGNENYIQNSELQNEQMKDESEVFNSFINVMVQIVEKYGKTVLQELDCAAYATQPYISHFPIKLWRWYDEQRRKEMCPVSESKYRNAGRRI